MMTIPQIRERLFELAAVHQMPELAELATQTKRRVNGARARRKAAPMDDALRDAIRAFVVARPGMSHMEVAVVFDVNTGRVSEALYGKRQ